MNVQKHLLATANISDRVQLSEFDIPDYQIKSRYATSITIKTVTNDLFKLIQILSIHYIGILECRN